MSEYHGCNVNASTYMLRSARWKYITYADGLSVPPQLFGELLISETKLQSLKFILQLTVFSSVLFVDLTLDKEELYNVAHKFPVVQMYLDKLLRSIVDYPKVSSAVHLYNKKAFSTWRDSLGRNYSSVIANLRWHIDWQNDVLANERAIDRWLYGSW